MQGTGRSEPGSYQPIRFATDCSSLDLMALSSLENNVKVLAIKSSIMPRVTQVWEEIVYVQPLVESLNLRQRSGGNLGRCFDAPIPADPIPETDYLLFINGETDDTFPCRRGDVAAYAGPCVFDGSRFNPRAVSSRFLVNDGVLPENSLFLSVVAIKQGQITFCLDRIKTVGNTVPLDEIETKVSVGLLEVGHALGLSADFFPFYIDPATDEPYGFGDFGPYECVSSRSTVQRLPAIIQPGSYADGAHSFYEITTPTLTRVVQNLFNCPVLSGARLENQPTSGGTMGSCIGSHLDERLFFDELMGGNHNGIVSSNHISAVTMAWLEETGWYKGDYTKASPISFGAGAGCDFVKEDCIDTGATNPSGDDIWCAQGTHDLCTIDHSGKALCGIFASNVPSEFQYFPNEPRLSGFPPQRDYCPLLSKSALPCDPGQKCFARNGVNSVCLDSVCDEASYTVRLRRDGIEYECTEDNALVEVGDLGFVICPRIAAVCPEMGCPALCSGRGTCDWSRGKPRCLCDDRDDDTRGCFAFVQEFSKINPESEAPVTAAVPGTMTPVTATPITTVPVTKVPIKAIPVQETVMPLTFAPETSAPSATFAPGQFDGLEAKAPEERSSEDKKVTDSANKSRDENNGGKRAKKRYIDEDGKGERKGRKATNGTERGKTQKKDLQKRRQLRVRG